MEDKRKEHNQKLYSKLYASIEDIRSAQYCADFLLKKDWHRYPWEARWTTYEQQSAFTTALVVSYGRLFSESKGWVNIPQKLLRLNDKEEKLHHKLIKLRNTIYAHSDGCHYSIKPYKAGDFQTDIVSAPFRRITKTDVKLFLSMTKKLIKAFEEKMDCLRNDIDVLTS